MKLPNNYGSIYKLKGNRRKPYCIRIGKKYIGYSETYQEALQTLAEYHNNPWDDNNVTYETVFEMWLKNEGSKLKPDTVQRYKRTFNCYCESIKDKKYHTITISDYYNILNDLDVTNGTKNNIIKFFKKMDRTAFKFDVVSKRETDKLDYFKKDPPAKRTPFTEEEINNLWDHSGDEDVDLVLILLYTGLQSGEFAALKLENVHEDYLIGGFKTDAGTDRYIPIHHRIKELIKNRVSIAERDTLLNYSSKQLRVRFKKALTNLGMTHTPHECRHTFITRLDDAGANKTCIHRIVGHADKDVTENVYTHKTRQQLKETIELLVCRSEN